MNELSDENLEEIDGVDNFISMTHCPMCEERLYDRTLLHNCEEGDRFRLDLLHCGVCGWIKPFVNHVHAPSLIDEEIHCSCEKT